MEFVYTISPDQGWAINRKLIKTDRSSNQNNLPVALVKGNTEQKDVKQGETASNATYSFGKMKYPSYKSCAYLQNNPTLS